MPEVPVKEGCMLRAGKVWVRKTARATTWLARLRGLLGCRALGPDAALLIERCGAVHTVGMRFAVDLVFLDRDWRVTRVVRQVPPGRLMVGGGWRAVRVLESEAGCVDVAGLHVGEKVTWQPDMDAPAAGEESE
ncbi:MAG TPA: DUF192 domain-containing protein [Kiritimatiellia bacterium]|nr:DUF192 domain-containing protein [Kiritimatiellia bacterium]